MMRKTVLITDGNERAALAVVRSLGSTYRCVVAAASRASLAGQSRFAAKSVVVPDPLSCPDDFASAIVEIVRREHVAVVLPISEAAILAVLAVRPRLGTAIVPLPDLGSFASLCDKRVLLEEAAKLGIGVPTQTLLVDEAAAGAADLSSLVYPVVLKPSRSVGTDLRGRTKLGVTYAQSEEELREKIPALPRAAFPLLLQQRIVGPGMGVFLLVWKGRIRAQFAHQRLCEKPPTGGVSVYRESVPMDPDLLDRSRALLERFHWEGVAMVEYKRDASTGQPYLMEVNGRFWGSLQLAIDAGVDFPRLLVECALGSDVGVLNTYRVGVRSRWWWGQIDHLIGRARTAAVPLPPGTRGAARAVADLLLGPFRTADYEEVLRWSDPRPFLNETRRWVTTL
jgi:predicted ATP-grasp superfamily ATP-dependent carboligase